MPAPRNRKHLVVSAPPEAQPFSPHPRTVKARQFDRPADRVAHAEALGAALGGAVGDAEAERTVAGVNVQGAVPGLYIQFESLSGEELKLESLENKRLGIELLTVQRVRTAESEPAVQYATVFVPDGALKHFFSRFEEYATKVTQKGEPKHKEMVDRIAALRRATLRALWTEEATSFPADGESIWWEVWLRRDEGRELERFLSFADATSIQIADSRLAFDDRLVILVHATSSELAGSLDVLHDLAELRRAKQSAAPFIGTPATEQVEWIGDLLARAVFPPADAPAICLLDTGVNRGHPLLEQFLSSEDATAVNVGWGSHDDGGGEGSKGHGTEMAGLAVFGDLAPIFASRDPVLVRHRLESVKILPPHGANVPELYGAITAQAVARPEITSPERPRVFSLAITAADQRDRGQPTSWSAAIDAMAVGRSFDPSDHGLRYVGDAEQNAERLFVISAGNVRNLDADHLARSDVEPVHDPAQAWNALAVGAYTEKALITEPTWSAWSPVARPGDLSPWSTTSVAFAEGWPIKPDVVFEGGNVATDGTNIDFPTPDLCLLSTHADPATPLGLSFATSAAAVQVARIATITRAEYPALWPETIRALIVHGARWTPAMQEGFDGSESKRARSRLVRRYGFGVPSLDRTLRSANDALTLIAEGVIHPFVAGKMREMHMHRLPWPVDALREVGAQGGAAVRLRVTLSYFIEPNPGQRGWRRRHRYASHGLRYAVISPNESEDDFTKRLNQRALAEEEKRPTVDSDSDEWCLGPEARNRGSLHSDVWSGTAEELADRSVIGIYPVSGWWKDQPKRDRSRFGARYALVIGIETDTADVDIWTPVATALQVPVVEVEGGW
ncbi:MAG: S8 family peptidase [Gemmatimonadota bacterium]